MDYRELFTAIYSQDNSSEGASGWIQWKGTDVCIDLKCVCGAGAHMDAEFFYFYECGNCHRKYAVGQTVKLIELTPEQAENEHCKDRFQSTDDFRT